MGARNRAGIGLSYWPARLQRLTESIPGLPKRLQIRALVGRYDNPIPPRFLAPIDCSKIPETVFVNVYGAQKSIPPDWESILGLLKGFTIRVRQCLI